MAVETVDLAYIGSALQRLTNELASLRHDMQVLTAIVHRLDNSHTRLLDEARANSLADRAKPSPRIRKPPGSWRAGVGRNARVEKTVDRYEELAMKARP